MSYDLRIAAYARPTADVIDDWARDNGLQLVAGSDGDSVTLQRPGKGEAGYVCEVWGPDPAEHEDFDEELAEACLAPRWMLQISVPYSAPKKNIALARSLARHVAERTGGAAFDPQEDRLLWPRGKQQRTPSRSAERETSMLELDWLIAPSRWRAAVEALVPLIARRCPEALPTRYGDHEPPPHRFDRSDPEPFVTFLAEAEAGDGLWYAARPSFGGSVTGPYSDKHATGEDERFRVGRLELSFDASLIAADERWREAVVDLFVRGAEVFGAFFAAAQVVPGWVVARNNVPYAQPESLGEGEHYLRGRLWQGLPPVPVWLSWYGDPYRSLVRDALRELDARDAVVDDREPGIFVRLSEDPQPRGSLPGLPLPGQLTYRERRAVESPLGGMSLEPHRPEDQANVIPPLE